MRVGGHPGTIMAKASKILAWAALTLLGLVAVLAAAIPTAAGRADGLAEKLAAHEGQTIDLVELGTGRRLVRPTLEGIVHSEA